ncbi:Tat pathway signal protein [Brevundimonas sp.]|uniref:Tat pathway signal protein n=1 Tax=Brevundimonas sp. TaxID=1871086 RepID=UPI003BAAEC55
MNRRSLFTLAPSTLAMGALGLASAVAGPAKASGGGGEKKASTASYVRFGTVTASIIRPDGRRGVMTVETGVDVRDETLRARAEQDGPRLRAAYNQVVQRFGAALLPGAAPDVDRLSRELQAATNATLRRGGATLLLGTVMVV